MKSFKFSFFLVTLLIASAKSYAGPAFTTIDSADLEKITQDFSAHFAHRTVTGAESYGNIFGFEVGLLGGSTQTPQINTISEASGGGSLSSLIQTGLMAGVSIPFGLTFEYAFLPQVNQSGVDFKWSSAALKWQLNDLIPVLPINLALKLASSSTDLSFEQTVLAATGKVTSTTQVTEIGLYLSPAIPIFEPYVGLSTLSSTGKLNYQGTGTIFDSALTTSNQAETSPQSTKLTLGALVNLGLLKFGAEYVSLYNTSGYSAKLSFGF